jgi:hypothetical protein
VATKTPVTLDSSDDDWVWCERPKEQAPLVEAQTGESRVVKSLSPVDPGNALGLLGKAIGLEGVRVVEIIPQGGKHSGQEILGGEPGGKASEPRDMSCLKRPELETTLPHDISGGDVSRQANISNEKQSTGCDKARLSPPKEEPGDKDLLLHATRYKLDPGTIILVQPDAVVLKIRATKCKMDDRAMTGSCAVSHEPGRITPQSNRVIEQRLSPKGRGYEDPVCAQKHPVMSIEGKGTLYNANITFGTPNSSPWGKLRNFRADRVTGYFPMTPQKTPTPPKEVPVWPVCRRLMSELQKSQSGPKPGHTRAGEAREWESPERNL